MGEKSRMVKVEVRTQTTYIIDLPIDSFSEICQSNMTLKESDEMLIQYLDDKLGVGVDEIISANERR